MQLVKVVVKGFRSLKNVELGVEKYTSLIGRNDAGKSSALRAIHLLLDAGSSVSADDVSKFNEEGDACYIEGTFTGTPGSCDLATDGTLILRRTFGSSGSRWEYVGPTPKNLTLKEMLAGTMTKAIYDSAALPGSVRNAIGPLPAGQLKPAQWIDAYRRAEAAGVVEKEPGLCPVQGSEIEKYVQAVFLPADVRAEDETTGAAKSVFGRIGAFLLRGITSGDAELNQAIATIKARIEELSAKNEDGTWQLETINRMKGVLDEEVHRFDPGVDIVPLPLLPPLAPIEFGMKLDVEDAHVKGLGKMGHGLRRSLVFAMLRTLTRMREMAPPGHAAGEDARHDSPLFLFLVEEPEIFLHPQAERKRMKDLEVLSREEAAQVIVCTHSAFFVDLLQYRGIVRVERPNRRETSVRQWTGVDLMDDVARHLKALKRFEPTSSAMLFADLAILVEGQTEKVCLPALAEQLGIPHACDVEVVDCGGAEGVVAYQELAECFGLKYVAWIDADKPSEITHAQGRKSDLGRLVVASPDWEGIAELVGISDKHKVAASWRKFVLNAEPVPHELKQCVYSAYNHIDRC